jgi:hypothetical protein
MNLLPVLLVLIAAILIVPFVLTVILALCGDVQALYWAKCSFFGAILGCLCAVAALVAALRPSRT